MPVLPSYHHNANRLAIVIFFLIIFQQHLIGGWNIGLSIILLLACLILFVKNAEYPKNLWEIYVITIGFSYFAFMAFINLNSEAPTQSFYQENFIWLFLWPIISTLRNLDFDRLIYFSIRIIFFSTIIIFILGLIERHVFEVSRIVWIARNPLTYACLITVGIHLSFLGWASATRFHKFLLLIAWALGFYIVMILTQARAASAAYVFSALITTLYLTTNIYWSNNNGLLKLLLILLSAIMINALILLLAIKLDLSSGLSSIFNSIISGNLSNDGSANARLQIYKYISEYFNSIPFLGLGGEDAIRVHLEKNAPDIAWTAHLHSDVLNHYFAGGIIATLLSSALLLTPILMVAFSKFRTARFVFVALIYQVSILALSLLNRVLWSEVRITWLAFCLVFLVLFYDYEKKRKIKSND